MNQSLHIFRKDIRHLTPELAMYGGLLVTFAVVTPLLWPGASDSEILQMFASLITFLLPVAWLVLVTRIVHEENLVGDQQFWVTRPYQWTSLLGAKLLFLAVCILVPFGAVQSYFILRAGLELGPALGSVFLNLFFVGIVLLSFTLLAAVTAAISRTILALTILTVGWAGVLVLLDKLTIPRIMPPFVFQTCSVLVAGLLVGLLIYQYATRHTEHTWRILLLTTAFYFGLYFCCSATNLAGLSGVLIRQHYPLAKSGTVSLSFTPSSSGPVARVASGSTNIQEMEPVELPIAYRDADPTARVQDASISFTIDGPDFHYASPWHSLAMESEDLILLVPSSVFWRVQGTSVRMHVSVAAERMLPGPPETVKVSDRFRVPDGGVCVLLKRHISGNNLSCWYAGHGPSPTRVTGPVSGESCGGATHTSASVIHSLGSGLRVDPVIKSLVSLGGAVCPGAELTFVPYRSAGNFRLEIDLPPLLLSQYKPHWLRPD